MTFLVRCLRRKIVNNQIKFDLRKRGVGLSWTVLMRFYSKTHYEVLGVKTDATTEEIKEAYIKKCKMLHPDSSEDDLSHDEFVKLQDSYNILSSTLSRRNYDKEIGLNLKYPRTDKIKNMKEEEKRKRQAAASSHASTGGRSEQEFEDLQQMYHQYSRK